MRDFKQLLVWQRAHQLTLELYKITATFPDEERFGLKSQIRRCAGSIGANIAEGCGRRGNGQLHNFLQIATGSVSELEYHLLLCRDLGYLRKDDHSRVEKSVIELRRMLASLIDKVDGARLASDFVSKRSKLRD